MPKEKVADNGNIIRTLNYVIENYTLKKLLKVGNISVFLKHGTRWRFGGLPSRPGHLGKGNIL
jgi:hypothetical protein